MSFGAIRKEFLEKFWLVLVVLIVPPEHPLLLLATYGRAVYRYDTAQLRLVVRLKLWPIPDGSSGRFSPTVPRKPFLCRLPGLRWRKACRPVCRSIASVTWTPRVSSKRPWRSPRWRLKCSWTPNCTDLQWHK